MTHKKLRLAAILCVALSMNLLGKARAAEPSAPVVSAVIQPQDAKVVAQATDALELFINGQFLGKVDTGFTRIRADAKPLVVGDNVIVFRAKKGSAATPYLLAEIAGAFGRVGTSTGWKAKSASSVEGGQANGAWSTWSYDDSAWAVAKEVSVAKPGGFPRDGASKAIWAQNSSAGTVLFRLRLSVPDIHAAIPSGYGRGVTGGEGGEIVRVSTPEQLAHELCRTSDGTGCTDDAPRIIEVASTIDFTKTEGSLTDIGCYQMKCPAPMQSELILEKNATVCRADKFNITYDKAGTTPLAVGSNKTLLGIGTAGVMRGKGLKLSGGVSNIVVRNMTFMDINAQVVWGGDAIRLSGADRVWIDHNRFWRIGRQMIVSNFEGASNVTVSWNEFDGTTPFSSNCNNTHYWVMLILGRADTFTVSNNWIHDFAGRAPHVGGNNAAVTMHLFNNYYQRGLGHAANPDTSAVKLLLEANYFQDVRTPVLREQTNPGLVFAPLSPMSSASQSACKTIIGRYCVPNLSKPQPTDGTAAFTLDTAVLEEIKTAPPYAIVKPYLVDKVPTTVPHLAGVGHL